MLPAPHRMRRSEDFTLAVRRGRRAGSTRLGVHLLVGSDTEQPARIGVVVTKAVGSAVARTRVKRQLRALAFSRLGRIPRGALAVLRANPAAAGTTSAVLGEDLDRALDRVLSARAPSGNRSGTTS